MTFEGIRPVLHLAFEKAPDELIRFGDLDRLVDRMPASGVDRLMVLPPIRAQRDEPLRHHFWRLADATGLPILALVAIDRALRAGVAAGADRLYRSILPLLAYEGQSFNRLFADLEGAEIPGFARVAA